MLAFKTTVILAPVVILILFRIVCWVFPDPDEEINDIQSAREDN